MFCIGNLADTKVKLAEKSFYDSKSYLETNRILRVISLCKVKMLTGSYLDIFSAPHQHQHHTTATVLQK